VQPQALRPEITTPQRERDVVLVDGLGNAPGSAAITAITEA
jgi:hypothetical protein